MKLHIIQRIHAHSGNWLTGSYFCSVTCYDMLASFTALVHTDGFVMEKNGGHTPSSLGSRSIAVVRQ